MSPYLWDLSEQNLSERDLRGIVLYNSKLVNANFWMSNLEGADISYANAQRTIFAYTNLTNAKLYQADLGDATLVRAKLVKANVSRATFDNVEMWHVDLRGADLRGANLSTTTYLKTSKLRDARFDLNTQFPVGFDPLAAGAILIQNKSAGL